MAFVVEDGTGKADATAYITVAFADAWFADAGGNATWTAATTDQKQAAIVKATRYIDQRFGPRLQSLRNTRTQSLEFPREELLFDDGTLRYDGTQMPTELQRACAEYAVRALSAALITDPTGPNVDELTEKIGPITRSRKFSRSGGKSSVVSSQSLREYPAADMWMESLLTSLSAGQLQRV